MTISSSLKIADTLRKLLGRTNRTLTLASAAVATVSAVQSIVPAKVPKSRLTLRCSDMERWWTASNAKRNTGVWKPFLKWYHGRPQSDCYVFEHRDGSDMVRRVDILDYNIRYFEEFE